MVFVLKHLLLIAIIEFICAIIRRNLKAWNVQNFHLGGNWP